MKPLNSPQKKKILSELNSQFGIDKLPFLLLQFGKDKYRIYSGDFTKEELIKMDRDLRIEITGLYFLKEQNDGLRLSIDGVQVLNDRINKGVTEISDMDSEKWFRGNDLEINEDVGFKILVNRGDFIGCGKSTGSRITNTVPKERRIRN